MGQAGTGHPGAGLLGTAQDRRHLQLADTGDRADLSRHVAVGRMAEYLAREGLA
jgi:hypothetical protein